MADITTSVLEFGSAAAQTAATAEVDEEKGKVRKFKFFFETKHLLLQAAGQHDAHRASHGKKNDTFGQVRKTIIKSKPTSLLSQHQKPPMKTLRDKLRSMLVDRSEVNLRIIDSSGIEENASFQRNNY